SAVKRTQYEKYEPVFWRGAKDSDVKQKAFFEAQVVGNKVVALVGEQGGQVLGFLIAALVPAPPVYDPGGLTCVIDDFCVKDPTDWLTVGAALLADIGEKVRRKSAVQIVVMCGHRDDLKRDFLASKGFGTATEIRVKALLSEKVP
ncbi:MAG TPA: hypothetical protein VIJ93_14580, partial [bacterium]